MHGSEQELNISEEGGGLELRGRDARSVHREL